MQHITSGPAFHEAVANAATFREPLPPGCPPENAGSFPPCVVLRLVPSQGVTTADFDSGAAAGGTMKPGTDPCEWCGCSVHDIATPRQDLRDLTRFPRLRKMQYIAHVRVDEKAGRCLASAHKKTHYNLWMYRTFNAVMCVEHVEPLQ